MMTLSKSLNASQAKKYYDAEYTNSRESYYSEEESIEGEWFGKLAKEWGLEGPVNKEAFARLTEGQHPHSGVQLVRRVTAKEYENQYGEKIKNSEHRAGFDATFSAPKSVSLAALVGDDERIREAHRKAVKTAMGELENYVQARMGGKTPAQTTRNFAAALFEHDSARPDKTTGYAAPQLHTHAVIFNLTQLEKDKIKPLQPVELYRSQKYATAIYRSVLSEELQKLGYEVRVDTRTGAPEIVGFSEEYLVASSPRRKQIEEEASEIKSRLAQQGINVKEGAGLNQAAAKLDRKSKHYNRAEMRERHQEMDAMFDHQAARVVEVARERGTSSLKDEDSKKRAQAAVTFARQNAAAREAVVDKRQVMVDALRRNMTFTTHDAVVHELSQRVADGEFIQIQRFDKFEELTTSQMLALERSNIHQMLAGRDTQERILKRKQASQLIKEIFERKGKKSTFDQYKAVGQILVSRDRVVGLQGLAGTGKTTALAILREAMERQGFVVQGLAPTGRAADKLAESGIKTTTLQGFLKEPHFDDESSVPANRRMYVLDESSLSDTRNLHLFLQKAGPKARILLVGDSAQHQAVEAGAPFEQLIKAGIRTARLDKILRQRTNLKKPVELLSQKEVLAAVEMLESQGRITEIKDDLERLKAIASDYVNNSKGTLIISPANSERVAINTIIHQQLQERGVVNRNSHKITVLVNRQDITGAERTFALAYAPGEDIIRYNTRSKVYDVKPGNYGRVLANDHKENTITVRLDSGREITYNPERLSGVSVYRETERDFAVGDRIQFRAPFAEGKVKNSELGTIKQIADGKMIVRLDKKRDVTFGLDQFRHIDLGYAVTSHSSQGQTVNRVLVNAETMETDLLLNQRMAYVAISRARFEARVYTDSLKELGPALNREKNKEIALDALRQTQAVINGKDASTPIANGFPTIAQGNGRNGERQQVAISLASQPSSTNALASIEADSMIASPFSERMRDLNKRLVLGRHLVATLNEKYTAKRLQEVLDTSNFRRYFVMDQTTGVRRRLSLNDIEQRAAHVAARIADEQASSVDGLPTAGRHLWSQLRDSEYNLQLQKHESTIREILDGHSQEVKEVTESLRKAQRTAIRTAPAAQAIQAATQTSERGSLTPIIPHERLNELQLDALHHRDVDSFNFLESIRREIPPELGGPERDTFSFRRLRAQSVLAESNLAVAQKRVVDFDRSRHFAKFEINGEQWSLVRVDRQQRLLERQIDFDRGAISAYRKRLYAGLQNPFKLLDIGEYKERAAIARESIANAREELWNLQPIRAEVYRLVETHRVELKESLQKERRLVATLTTATDEEMKTRGGLGQQLLDPEFNSHELKHLEENSITLRDQHMLQIAQNAMELQGQNSPDRYEQLAARALGRSQAADISFQEITERIQSFTSNREFFPVLFKGADGNDKTSTLRDLQPRTLTDRIFNYFSPAERFQRDAINDALDQHQAYLLSERDSLEQFASGANQIARKYRESLTTLDRQVSVNLAQRIPQPEFKVREIAQIESFAMRQVDESLRMQLEGMMRSAVKSAQGDDFTGWMPKVEQRNDSLSPGVDTSQRQLAGDDYVETARKILNHLAANAGTELGTVNEAVADLETDEASQVLAALL
jgi:conjugative relaxase-like TrwC/TraI family protein